MNPSLASLQAQIQAKHNQDTHIAAKLAANAIVQRLFQIMLDSKGVHVESALAALGTLAGQACQYRALAGQHSLSVVNDHRTGQRYYYGDALNRFLLEDKQSVWSLVARAVQSHGKALPDIDDIIAHTTRTIGTEQFGQPRLSEEHPIRQQPKDYLALWAIFQQEILEALPVPKNDWVLAYALAIQNLIDQAKEVIDPSLAGWIVMECAVPMSKIITTPLSDDNETQTQPQTQLFENGFVLLNQNKFDFQQLLHDLQTQWQITATEVTIQDGSMMCSIGQYFCVAGLMPKPIPNNEAVKRAQVNYYCADAVSIAQAHQAHLMVTLVAQSDTENSIQCMRLYSKIIACCLRQQNATGVYTSGTVFSADFYTKIAEQYLRTEDIPIMIWVFIGLAKNEKGNQLYTIGMEKFQKEEMEILNSQMNMKTLHASLTSMCHYIITSGLVLKDGETIGFSAEQKWAISHSKSVYALSEYSLKIAII